MVALLIGFGPTQLVVNEQLGREILPPRSERSRVAVITQPGATRYALLVADLIGGDGYQVEVIGVPDREAAKTLEVAGSVYEGLARFGLGRHDTIVGVGGGSVTDLAGFVGGTWLRGIEVVHVPTTLVAAIDASIGGKTGINLAGKNMIGAFWHPTRVTVALDILSDLPLPLRREGLAEALKCGLIGDPALFELLEKRGLEAPLGDVVRRSVSVKMALVSADERESGERAFLNLGHTIGHAVEFASTLSHGESVGLGIISAVRVSEKRLGFSDSIRVVDAVLGLGVPSSVTGLDSARVRDLLQHDKKRDHMGLRMVLLEEIGSPQLVSVDDVDISIGLRAIGL